jgi:hypothetical protein
MKKVYPFVAEEIRLSGYCLGLTGAGSSGWSYSVTSTSSSGWNCSVTFVASGKDADELLRYGGRQSTIERLLSRMWSLTMLKISPYNLKVLLPMLMIALASALSSCSKNDNQTNAEDPKIKKEDFRIGWSLRGGGSDVGGDGDAFFTKAMDRAKELKKLPTTGDIIFYVYNENGYGPPKNQITWVVENLVDLKENYGVKHEPGKIYVNDFERADSIVAKQKLNLTIDLWSRKK